MLNFGQLFWHVGLGDLFSLWVRVSLVMFFKYIIPTAVVGVLVFLVIRKYYKRWKK